ncbi:MAG: N-6 DNA methylase, partial [Woeseiaceae bacterium]
MAAWAIVSIWIVAVATGNLCVTASLADAEDWFFGRTGPVRLTKLLSVTAKGEAERALQIRSDSDAYIQLLPYILDPHGPGSRLSVRRDPTTRTARTRKRAEGVFYTPADVAEFMVRTSLDSLDDGKASTVFDPACGTGVFLRAALKELRKRHPDQGALSLAKECLFGVDIDPWPVDASAFVLLADILIAEGQLSQSPAEVWLRLKLNLACSDALTVDPALTERVGERVSISDLCPELKSAPT